MKNQRGAVVSSAPCLIYLAILAWPYTIRPPSAITTYYLSGILEVLNPLFAGVLVATIPIGLIAVRKNHISVPLGAGVVLGLSLSALLIVMGWAVTTRLDVFRASGWALPAQRFILVALSILIVFGTAWYAWKNVSHRSVTSPTAN